MQLLECECYGDVPVFSPDAICSVERVSKNKIRVGLCVIHRCGGRTENRAILYLDWDRDVYISLFDIYLAANEIVAQPEFPALRVPAVESIN